MRFLQNKEHQDKIVYWIGECLQSRNACCKRLGIDPALLRIELQKDSEFRARVAEAETKSEDALVNKVKNSTDWRASWSLLTTKFADNWARKPNTFTQEEMTEFAAMLMQEVARFVAEDQEEELNKRFKKIIENFAKRKIKKDIQQNKAADIG